MEALAGPVSRQLQSLTLLEAALLEAVGVAVLAALIAPPQTSSPEVLVESQVAIQWAVVALWVLTAQPRPLAQRALMLLQP